LTKRTGRARTFRIMDVISFVAARICRSITLSSAAVTPRLAQA
jgi:hypothetical protein